MESEAIEYVSFVRGFIAAMDRDLWGGPDGEVDTAAYSDGFAAGAAADGGEHPETYLELSVQEGGQFSGTLDVAALESAAVDSYAGYAGHYGYEPAEPDRREPHRRPARPPETAAEIPLSGTLDLSQ